MNYFEIDYRKAKECADILRAITHPLRLSIIFLLDKEGIINVNKIYSSLNLEQSITSQHLKILRDNQIVITERKGKLIFYSLNYKRIGAVSTATMYFDELTRERNKRRKQQASSQIAA